MKILQISVLTLFLSLIFVSQTFACSYMYQSPQEYYDNSSVVFIGEITKLKEDGNLNGTRTVTFDIKKSYKGVNLPNTLTLTTGANSAMCGYDEGSLSEGDIWTIYTSDTNSFNSSPGNQKYKTVDGARAAVNMFIDDDHSAGGQTICPLNYAPVCGQKDTGIRCITTPCPSTETKTYGNSCQLAADKAELLYEGECKTKPDIAQEKPVQGDVDIVTEDFATDTPGVIEETKKPGIFNRILTFFKQLFSFGY